MVQNKCTTGWLKEVRDPSDYHVNTPGMDKLIAEFSGRVKKPTGNGNSVDLASNGGGFASIAIKAQGMLNSCTAHAVVGLLEYFRQVTNHKGKHVDFSRLFLYKATRLLQAKQLLDKEKLSSDEKKLLEDLRCDSGAGLRATLEVMRTAGVPLEDNFCYQTRTDEDDLCQKGGWNDEPECKHYHSARDHKGITYYSLIDSKLISGECLLARAEESLEKSIPFAFGFDVYTGIEEGVGPGNGKKGHYPYRGNKDDYEKCNLGHAAIAVGYDRTIEVYNGRYRPAQKGALKIRNSYGTKWGNQGYGWLSYDYIRKGLAYKAVDGFFCLINTEF